MDRDEATRLWEQFRRNGDPAILERLYNAYRIPVMRYCRARIADEEAAETVTDQTFAYLALAKPACTGSFESLVIFYAGLRCANYRSPGRFQPLPDDVKGPASAPSILEADERQHAIQQALKQLPADQREVVHLHFLQGLPLSETARIIGVPRWKAKGLRTKALRRLHRILKKLEF